MSTTEDRARAAMRAVAATVNDAPPLALKPAPDPGSAPGQVRRGGSEPHRTRVDRSGTSRPGRAIRGLRRPGGTVGPSGNSRDRRWQPWLTPLTAAAVVVALAVSLVIVKGMHDGPVLPGKGTGAVAGSNVGGPRTAVPRYYVALKQSGANGSQDGIVVGDSVTGKTLATFAPPANTTFQSVTAAADDRTFVVTAVTFPGKPGQVFGHATLTGTWYKVRLAPGSAHPASLTRLPVNPVSWVSPEHPELNPRPGQVFATVLSPSGQELAVSDIPNIPAANAQPRDWEEVKVFSVATGRLLHDWIGHDPTSNIAATVTTTFWGVPGGTPDLTWIDGDGALALATSYQASKTVVGGSTTMTRMVRRLNVAGPASGNLLTDSTVLWSGTVDFSGGSGCLVSGVWPPQLSADGSTVTCVTGYGSESLSFVTEPLAAGNTASTKPTVVYQVKAKQVGVGDWLETNFLWVSPSADTFIVQWVSGGNGLSLPNNAGSGVVSHGKYTPLRIPKSVALSAVDITF